MTKLLFSEAKIKDLLAVEEIQTGLRKLVSIPTIIMIKSVRNPFKNDDTGETTQKIHAVAGTTLEDMSEVDFTLVNTTLDAEQAINKRFKIEKYTLGLEANMRGGNFNGYQARGLRLFVTQLEQMKVGEK